MAGDEDLPLFSVIDGRVRCESIAAESLIADFNAMAPGGSESRAAYGSPNKPSRKPNDIRSHPVMIRPFGSDASPDPSSLTSRMEAERTSNHCRELQLGSFACWRGMRATVFLTHLPENCIELTESLDSVERLAEDRKANFQVAESS